MGEVGAVLLAHGSREDKETTGRMERLLEVISGLFPERVRVRMAYLQFNHPGLEDTVLRLKENSITEIYILPLFVLQGRHLREDVPSMVERLSGRHPDVRLRLCRSLGEQEWFFEAVSRWISDELMSASLREAEGCGFAMTGTEIMKNSMRIAENLLAGRPQRDGETKVLLRILHATGDPTILGSVVLSRDAVASGVRALRLGRPVLTDVGMVKAGLSRGLLERLGCPLRCAAEETAEEPARGTRVGMGIRSFEEDLGGSVVVIGNAPTALLSVVDLVRRGSASPSLIVGTPVGFVQAMESKRLLSTLGLPYITVQGTRGGSAIAVAATNALLEMAAE